MLLIRKIYFLLAVICLLATSCSQGDYEMGTSYEVTFGVVKERGDHKLYLYSDGGLSLFPSTSLDSINFKVGERYRVTYVRMNGYYTSDKEASINVSDMQRVLVKDAVPVSDFSGLLKDPIWVMNKPWFGGGYLNFEFSFSFSDSKIKHGIYLVQDSIGMDNKIYMTFGHDANGDLPQNTTIALASFPLKSISRIDTADSLIICVPKSNAAKVYKLAVKL